MNNFKISLIIPAYNEEKYIEACLQHAVRNRGAFFEIIVVDNASRDRTGQIAQKFSNVHVVREEQKGLTHARQRGFLEAMGDLVAYIDADTRMPLGWHETVLREFSANPRLVCLSGPYIYYDIPRWKQFFVWAYWYLLAMPMYLVVGYMVVGGNFVIRRDALEKMNGFDTSIAFYGEDTNIARRAHKYGTVKFTTRFVMHTSGRRFSGQGLVKTAVLYILNALSELVMHKPMTKEYKDIR